MTKPIKILHGPKNIVGLGGSMAKLERELGLDSRFVTYRADGPHQNYDRSLDLDKYSWISGQFRVIGFFLSSLFKYDIFHFYFGTSFFLLGIDLPIIKLFGKKIVMTYCGSDVRLVKEIVSKRNPYHHLIAFRGSAAKPDNFSKNWFLAWVKRQFVFRYNSPIFDRRKKIQMRYHNLFVDKFIAPLDIIEDTLTVIPKKKIISDLIIHHISITEDPVEIKKNVSNADEKTMMICHAPTFQGLKGTKYIEKAIEDLRREGLNFDYCRIENVSHEQASSILRDKATIIIDQVLLGSYGLLAAEGMSYGKPIVGYIIDQIKDQLCPDLPVYNANIDNLTDRLRNLITNPALIDQLGKEGVQFCHKYYNRKKMGNRMVQLYQGLMKMHPRFG